MKKLLLTIVATIVAFAVQSASPPSINRNMFTTNVSPAGVLTNTVVIDNPNSDESTNNPSILLNGYYTKIVFKNGNVYSGMILGSGMDNVLNFYANDGYAFNVGGFGTFESSVFSVGPSGLAIGHNYFPVTDARLHIRSGSNTIYQVRLEPSTRPSSIYNGTYGYDGTNMTWDIKGVRSPMLLETNNNNISMTNLYYKGSFVVGQVLTLRSDGKAVPSNSVMTAFGFLTNTAAFNTPVTNTSGRPIEVHSFFTLTGAAATDTARVSVMVSNNSGAFTWAGTRSVGPGDIAPKDDGFSFSVNTNGVFYLTNKSSGSATATMLTNMITLH